MPMTAAGGPKPAISGPSVLSRESTISTRVSDQAFVEVSLQASDLQMAALTTRTSTFDVPRLMLPAPHRPVVDDKLGSERSRQLPNRVSLSWWSLTLSPIERHRADEAPDLEADWLDDQGAESPSAETAIRTTKVEARALRATPKTAITNYREGSQMPYPGPELASEERGGSDRRTALATNHRRTVASSICV